MSATEHIFFCLELPADGLPRSGCGTIVGQYPVDVPFSEPVLYDVKKLYAARHHDMPVCYSEVTCRKPIRWQPSSSLLDKRR